MSTVKIAELKAHLSKHLRAVRRGERITVLDREQPIATLVPYEDRARLFIRAPRVPLHSRPLPTARLGAVDPVDALVAERKKDRR